MPAVEIVEDCLGGNEALGVRRGEAADWEALINEGLPVHSVEVLKRSIAIPDSQLAELVGISEKTTCSTPSTQTSKLFGSAAPGRSRSTHGCGNKRRAHTGLHKQRDIGLMTKANTSIISRSVPVAALLLAACSLASAAPPSDASTNKEAATALRVERLEIIDHKGFEKPMVAATVMVPAGWQRSGEVVWNPGQRCGKAYAPMFKAVAPDGSSAIELSAQETWGATNYGMPIGECPQAHLAGAREYLDSWVQRHRPNARLLDYKPRLDRSRVLGEHQSAGAQLRAWVDSGQALIGYRVDGREVFELLATNVSYTHTRLAGGFGAQTMESLQGQALGVLSWRTSSAPVSQRHFDLVWDTLKAAPEWSARIAAAESQIAADNAATQAQIGRIQAETSRETLQHMAKRGQIRQQTQQEIAQMRNEGWQSSQNTQERMRVDNVRSIREVHGYRDARTGGVVELSNHYNHAWQLRDGSYVLTDDPNFDPARAFGVQGERLQRTRE